MTVLTHFFDWVGAWLEGLERARNEAWLAGSTDIFELEARLRELERRHP